MSDDDFFQYLETKFSADKNRTLTKWVEILSNLNFINQRIVEVHSEFQVGNRM